MHASLNKQLLTKHNTSKPNLQILIVNMGAAASTVSPEVFASLRDEYEKKKAEGLSDIELFDHLKSVFEKNSSVTVAVATVSVEASTGGNISDPANSDNTNNSTVVVNSENNGEGVTVTAAVATEI